MPVLDQNLWDASDAYERYMGRWSRRVAPIFTDWLDMDSGARWLDVGCGTGVLTSTVLATCEPSAIVGIDSSDVFLKSACSALSDPRVSFTQGDAQTISEDDDAFDVVVSGLVLNFVLDKDAAVREMSRVVRPGGIVGLYVWDYAGHMQVMRTFFDVATALDASAADFGQSLSLLHAAGLPIPQIAVFADVCRSVVPDVAQIGGGSIVGRSRVRPPNGPFVDRFLATRLGDIAQEVRAADRSQSLGVFSRRLLRALNGEQAELIDVHPPARRVVTSHKLVVLRTNLSPRRRRAKPQATIQPSF